MSMCATDGCLLFCAGLRNHFSRPGSYPSSGSQRQQQAGESPIQTKEQLVKGRTCTVWIHAFQNQPGPVLLAMRADTLVQLPLSVKPRHTHGCCVSSCDLQKERKPCAICSFRKLEEEKRTSGYLGVGSGPLNASSSGPGSPEWLHKHVSGMPGSSRI